MTLPTTPVALQLFSLREDAKLDFARTVAEVAAIGYQGVELAGYGSTDAKGAKAAIDQVGLKIVAMHVGVGLLQSELNKVIDEALLLGAPRVVCAWWPQRQYASRAACEMVGERLAETGRVLRGYGLGFGLHNHADELQRVEGRPVLDWMLGAAAPRDLFAELDVFWAHSAGLAPADVIRTHGTRVPLLHLKDAKELGLGPVDFKAVFEAADRTGAVEWFVVEQTEYSHPPLESVRRCFVQLQQWGRA